MNLATAASCTRHIWYNCIYMCIYVCKYSIWISAISACVDNLWEQLQPINGTRHQTKPIKTIIFTQQHSPTCREAVYYICTYKYIYTYYMWRCVYIWINTYYTTLLLWPKYLYCGTYEISVQLNNKRLVTVETLLA